MAYTIKLLEVTDPFAEDFGLTSTKVKLTKSMTVEEFLLETYPGEDMYAYVNFEECSLADLLMDNDALMVSAEIHKSTLRLVATIAVLITAVVFAPYLAPGIATLTGLTTAQATMVGMMAISMVGNILVNALIPADKLDTSNQGIDQSKAYQWGGGRNTSEQMIPIPVVLGTFQVAGNLINSYTETYGVHSSGISIRDTIYLLYGLTSNELLSINSCSLNDMAADSFDETDRSIYYTLGVQDQEAITSDTDSVSNVFPLYVGETAPPASLGPLFPNLVTEDISNQDIPLPYHQFLETKPPITVFKDGPPITSINATLVSALTAGTIGVITLNVYDFTGTFPATGVIVLEENVNENAVKTNMLAYNTGSETDGIATITITSRQNDIYDFSAGAVAHFFEYATSDEAVVTTLTQSETDAAKWYERTQEKRTAYIEQAVTGTVLDDIKIQIVFPKGLYNIGNTSGDKFPKWVGFDFKIKRVSGANTYYRYFDMREVDYFLASDAVKTDSLTATEQKYTLAGKFTSTQFIEFKVLDILQDCNRSGDDVLASFVGDDGYLLDGTYTVGVRLAITGSITPTDNCPHAFDPNADDNEGTDFYACMLTKVQAIKYDTILNYPNISLLALALNSTPVLNNQLPKQVIEATGKFYYYVASDKYEVSKWTQGECENPAYLAINMMYNKLWGAGIGGLHSSATKDADFAAAVDIDKFVELADHCATLIALEAGGATSYARYTFNGIIDSRIGFWEALTIVLSSANAVPIYDGKRISVYWEKASTGIKQLFTTSVIAKDSFSESFIGNDELAECISGNFIDASDNYAKTSIIYMMPGADPNKVVNIELYGIVDSRRAIRALKQKLEKTHQLARIFDFKVADSSAIACEVGDDVGIQYEFITFPGANENSVAGRIKSIDGSLQLTLDKLETEVTTPHLVVRTSSGDIYTWAIDVWSNAGTTTVITLDSGTDTDEYDKLEVLDIYLIGSAAEYYKEVVITSIDINPDLSCDVNAIEYSAELYDNFYGITINAELNPTLVKADFIVNNLTATTLAGGAISVGVKVSWTAPLFTSIQPSYYLIYRKMNNGAIEQIATVETQEYIDRDFTMFDQLYYKVLPVFNYQGTDITIPLGWADYSTLVSINTALMEYLEAPEFTGTITENASGVSLYDITLKITDPGDWMYKDRREGFLIWTRLSDSNATDDWFGPTDITLTAAATPGCSTITVSDASSLPVLHGTSNTCCILLIDDIDLVLVYGQDAGNANKLNVVYNISDFDANVVNRKFAVGKSHDSDVKVYNAHKGFFPIKYFGAKENCTAYDRVRQITCTAIWTYNAIDNEITNVSSFDTTVLNSGSIPTVYVDGNSSTLVAIESFTSDSMFLSLGLGASDFTVNIVGQDVTGQKFGLYGMYWESDNPYEKIKVNEDGLLEGTIVGFNLATKYGWVAINRLMWEHHPIEHPKTKLWISNLRPYLG